MSNQKHAARASAPKPEAPPAAPAPKPQGFIGGALAAWNSGGSDAPAPIEAPFAYAIVEGPPGQWTAVCLEGVTARSVEKLEPNGDAEPEVRAMQRLQRAIEMRTIGKRWSK